MNTGKISASCYINKSLPLYFNLNSKPNYSKRLHFIGHGQKFMLATLNNIMGLEGCNDAGDVLRLYEFPTLDGIRILFFFLSDMNISLQLKRNVFSLIPLVVIFASGPSINDIAKLGGICQKVTLLHQPI